MISAISFNLKIRGELVSGQINAKYLLSFFSCGVTLLKYESKKMADNL